MYTSGAERGDAGLPGRAVAEAAQRPELDGAILAGAEERVLVVEHAQAAHAAAVAQWVCTTQATTLHTCRCTCGCTCR